MIRYFASLKFAFFSILALAAWMITGGILAGGEAKKAFRAMNDALIVDWFFENFNNNPLQIVWLVVFCAIGALVFFSFLACTFTSLWRMFKARKNSVAAVSLFLLHFLFITILSLHVVSMTTGIKKGYVPVSKGDTVNLSRSYTAVVTDLKFSGDEELLYDIKGASRIRYTRENYDPDNSYVSIDLIHNNKIMHSGISRYMDPLKHRSFFVCLESFQHNKKNNNEIGARITIVRNVTIYPFFVLYSLSVVILIVLILSTSGYKPRPVKF